MKRILLTMLAIVGLTAAVATAPVAHAAPPAPGHTEVVVTLIFNSATNTFTFQVDAAQGAGVLTVETLDCCIAGDLWKVELLHGQASGNDKSEGTGDGNVVSYSGAASHNGWSKGTVVVSYAGGTDVFPAQMDVKFTFSSNGNGKAKGNTGITVTQLP
jgi:hypothetical protein